MASLPTRSTLLSVFAFAFALAAATAQDLPKRTGPADFDPEPKLMLNDLPDLPLLGGGVPGTADRPPADIGRLEAAVERAKKNAVFRERLMKAGILSKLEAEQGEMAVVRITKDLENARLETAKREAEDLRKKPATDEAAKTALADAEARVATAATAAQDATTKWEQAQRAAAELRVQRERKLMALGAGSKSSLKRAETALQNLIGNSAPPARAPVESGTTK
jgi:hypothetical protein